MSEILWLRSDSAPVLTSIYRKKKKKHSASLRYIGKLGVSRGKASSQCHRLTVFEIPDVSAERVTTMNVAHS
jgi:hypothetical protein